MAYGLVPGLIHSAVNENYTFEQLVWQQCRSYGALIHMRDLPTRTPIPMVVEPDTHHKDCLEAALQEKSEFEAMDEAQLRQKYDSFIQQEKEQAEEIRTSIEAQNKIVQSWIAQAEQLQPGVEHEGFVSDLLVTLKNGLILIPESYEPPSYKEWLESELYELAYDIDYHATNWRKEQENATARTAWLAGVADMLQKVSA